MPAKKTDQFANKFYATVTESGANTLTFSEIHTSVDVFSKRAWIIHKLEFYLGPAALALFTAGSCALDVALCSSDKVSALGLDDPAIIDLMEMSFKLATGVGYNFMAMPIIREFNTMPGGGLIISPRPLFLAAKGNALAGASTVALRGYFTAQDLSADEYLELVDFYRIVS